MPSLYDSALKLQFKWCFSESSVSSVIYPSSFCFCFCFCFPWSSMAAAVVPGEVLRTGRGRQLPPCIIPALFTWVVLTANHREMFVTSWCLIWVLNVFRQACPTCGPHAAWPNLSSGPTPEPCHHGGSSAFLSCLSQPQTHIHCSQQPNTGAQLMLSGLKLCQQYCLSKSTGIRS